MILQKVSFENESGEKAVVTIVGDEDGFTIVKFNPPLSEKTESKYKTAFQFLEFLNRKGVSK